MDHAPDAADIVAETIRSRRTSLLVDADRPVPAELVGRLIDLATWAPNHKRTWPWRFTVLEGTARDRFGEALAARAEAAGVDAPKVAKLRTKYRRSPVVVLVWVKLDGDEVRRREDRDATAAAVQTLLLAATAEGLGNYWATIPDVLVPSARAVAGVDGDHDLVALVYLGWPVGDVARPERPAPEVRWLPDAPSVT
jgi:nitroreductase